MSMPPHTEAYDVALRTVNFPSHPDHVFIMHRDTNDDGHTLEKRLQDGLRPSGRGTKEGVYFRIPRVYNHRAYDALLSDVDRIKYLYPDLFEYNIASAHVDNNIVYFSTLGYDSKCVVKNQNTKKGSMAIGEFLNYMDATSGVNTREHEILFQGEFPAIAAYMQFRMKEEHITEVSLTICSGGPGGARPKHTTYYDLYDSYYITRIVPKKSYAGTSQRVQMSTRCRQCGKNQRM
jgi:hypothetical protein